ncbi:MAG: hypothetical protein NC935_02950 [Candidatus Omnitrophica bacterium]|nr:hypothetical protein [Candidatus Omnitrophota bacterium]
MKGKNSLFFLLKKNSLLLFVFSITFIVGLPSLFVPWSFIDDGYNHIEAQKMTGLLKEKGLLSFLDYASRAPIGHGRFMPFYFIFHWVRLTVSGKNYALCHFIHIILFTFTVFFIFKTVDTLTHSSLKSFLSSVFFILSAINIENIYRLGPQEPFLAFLLSASLFFLFRKKMLLSLFFNILLFLTKETSIVIVPFTFVLYTLSIFTRKNKEEKRYFLKYFIFNLFFGVVATFFILRAKERYINAYSGGYQFNPDILFRHFFIYLKIFFDYYNLLLLITFGLFFYRILSALKKREFLKDYYPQLVFLIIFGFYLVILLPWKVVLTRYLLPAMIGFSIFMGIETGETLNLLRRLEIKEKLSILNRKFVILFKYFFVFLLFLTLSFHLLIIKNHIGVTVTQHNKEMIKFLSTLPKNSQVFLNFKKIEDTVEYFYEIPLHLSFFYNRNDLKFSYLDLGRQKFKKGDYIVSGDIFPRYSEEEISTLSGIIKIKNFSHKPAEVVICPPSCIIKKTIFNFPTIIFKPRFFLSSLYSFSRLNFYWNIYGLK